ncbi:hypothetical protein [Anaerotignum sp.]|uniref:RNA polymerase sigma factor n=1 Tax=Anaerotignum sp. TaxID=2039241 RepID=UPI0033179E91
MKIMYKFADGTASEVEVNEEIGAVVLDSRRVEDNLGRKERYHCLSLDAVDFEGEEFADKATPESILMNEIDNQHMAETLDKLSDVQKRRLLMYAEGYTFQQIADFEQVSLLSVYESVNAARKKFKKLF